MEMADAIAINKADGKNVDRARLAQTEFSRALHLYPPKENEWTPKVLSCSATENTGILEIWDTISDFLEKTKKNGHFQRNRNLQNKNWFLQSLNQQLTQIFQQNDTFLKARKSMLLAVEKNTVSPFKAAKEVLKVIHNQLK